MLVPVDMNSTATTNPPVLETFRLSRGKPCRSHQRASSSFVSSSAGSGSSQELPNLSIISKAVRAVPPNDAGAAKKLRGWLNVLRRRNHLDKENSLSGSNLVMHEDCYPAQEGARSFMLPTGCSTAVSTARHHHAAMEIGLMRKRGSQPLAEVMESKGRSGVLEFVRRKSAATHVAEYRQLSRVEKEELLERIKLQNIINTLACWDCLELLYQNSPTWKSNAALLEQVKGIRGPQPRKERSHKFATYHRRTKTSVALGKVPKRQEKDAKDELEADATENDDNKTEKLGLSSPSRTRALENYVKDAGNKRMVTKLIEMKKAVPAQGDLVSSSVSYLVI